MYDIYADGSGSQASTFWLLGFIYGRQAQLSIRALFLWFPSLWTLLSGIDHNNVIFPMLCRDVDTLRKHLNSPADAHAAIVLPALFEMPTLPCPPSQAE